ncbi:MAG: hypothetical protein HY925_09925 [Elusimicrobia bacterium]|nr:hypothetical protein [Elusimicrobiota bacterium]
MTELEPSGPVDEPEVIAPGESPRAHKDQAAAMSWRLRLKLAGALAGGGVFCLGAGALLTLTIIGAPVGIVLGLLGLGLFAAAAMVLFGKATLLISR